KGNVHARGDNIAAPRLLPLEVLSGPRTLALKRARKSNPPARLILKVMKRPPPTTKRLLAPVALLLAGLLLVLPFVHHAAAGLLVCFGADGHIGVEDGRWSDCATGDIVVPHAPMPVAQQAPEDDCGD